MSLDNPEVLILIVYVTGAILQYLMQVYLSKKFLLKQKVGLPPVLSEILHTACMENPGTVYCIRPPPDMPLTRYDQEGFHIEAKC